MLADGFSRFLGSDPGRLHAAAHSHHPWPDVTFAAHEQAWTDAAAMHDDKWDHVFGEVLPEARWHVARRLGLSDPSTVAMAPNTHELVVRLFSCLEAPVHVLTTDAEFHSFDRQLRRWEEAGQAVVERVAARPYGTFAERFAEAAAAGGHGLLFLSHVHFDSGYVTPDLATIVGAVPDDDAFVVVDGYHGFMALPTDLGDVEARVFYLAGGYKYAMAGEGAVFLHCPPGYGPRPVDTGWFAGFSALTEVPDEVAYAPDGSRFLGATFAPTCWYRFNAVQRWLDEVDVDVGAIHAHVRALQARLLERLGDGAVGALEPGSEVVDRGNFLSFTTPDAAGLDAALRDREVIVDHRGDRLRIGLGVYHDDAAVDALAERVAAALEELRAG